jgi:hypothetical protein
MLSLEGNNMGDRGAQAIA